MRRFEVTLDIRVGTFTSNLLAVVAMLLRCLHGRQPWEMTIEINDPSWRPHARGRDHEFGGCEGGDDSIQRRYGRSGFTKSLLR